MRNSPFQTRLAIIGLASAQVFHRVIPVPDGDGRAGIGQAERRTRAVCKLDFELGFGLLNGLYFASRR
jgi:hypothetical protein